MPALTIMQTGGNPDFDGCSRREPRDPAKALQGNFKDSLLLQ